MYDYKKLDFGRLAELTGGRKYEPATMDQKDLAKVLHSIATEISMENVEPPSYRSSGPSRRKTPTRPPMRACSNRVCWTRLR